MGKPTSSRTCPLCRKKFRVGALEQHMRKCSEQNQIRLDETFTSKIDLTQTYDQAKLEKVIIDIDLLECNNYT